MDDRNKTIAKMYMNITLLWSFICFNLQTKMAGQGCYLHFITLKIDKRLNQLRKHFNKISYK